MALKSVNGQFYRIVLQDRLSAVLDPPSPTSAGRYHRLGQPALYMSPTPALAMIAMDRYMRGDGLRRVIVPLRVEGADLFDQRDAVACATLGIDPRASALPWQEALAAGQEPPSWRNADIIRAAGADGLIHQSKAQANGWHVTLFRWNEAGGPSVVVDGEPVDIKLPA